MCALDKSQNANHRENTALRLTDTHTHTHGTTITKEPLGPKPHSQETCLGRGPTSEHTVGCLDVSKAGRMHFWG